MRFASLGSGSGGNALVVQAGSTLVMIDCGFGVREAISRCERLGIRPEALSALIITHEHSDHIGGAPALARRYRIPVWLSHGTLHATEPKWHGCQLRGFDSHEHFSIDALQINPFPVPHDAREPVQLTLSDGAHRLGVLTDVGMVTPHIEHTLSGCHALVLEANHCEDLLRRSSYPASLKARIAGRLGHLSNRAAAGLLQRLHHDHLQHIVAAHLSAENNLPQLAQGELAHALGSNHDDIHIASQDQGLHWLDLRSMR